MKTRMHGEKYKNKARSTSKMDFTITGSLWPLVMKHDYVGGLPSSKGINIGS